MDRQGFSPFGVVDAQGMKVVDMLYDQYGDSAGPDQDQIAKQGKPYIDKGWPKLDSIKSATLVGAAAEAAPAKPASRSERTGSRRLAALDPTPRRSSIREKQRRRAGLLVSMPGSGNTTGCLAR